MWTLKGQFSLLVILLLLAGCSETIGEEKEKGVVTNFIEGVQDTVYENQEYLIIAEVKNSGDYDYPYGKVVLTGFDNSILPFGSQTKRNTAVKEIPELEGSTEYNELGGIGNVEFRIPPNHITVPYEGDYNPSLKLNTCYYYETVAVPSVCIVPDPAEADHSICTPDARKIERQNAPVVVTKIDEEVDKDFVHFTATIENIGEGEVVAPAQTSYENCPTNLKRTDMGIVEAEMEINNFPEAECANDGEVKLNNGKGKVMCEFQIRPDDYDVFTKDPESEPFIKQLKINLKYHYKTQTSKEITVKDAVDSHEEWGDSGNPFEEEEGEPEEDTESKCSCEAKEDNAPIGPCVCLYYDGEEHFCDPSKDKPLVVGEEDPKFTVYTSNPEVVKECGISGEGKTDCGKSKTYELGLKEGDKTNVAVIGENQKGAIVASQWCKIRREE